MQIIVIARDRVLYKKGFYFKQYNKNRIVYYNFCCHRDVFKFQVLL